MSNERNGNRQARGGNAGGNARGGDDDGAQGFDFENLLNEGVETLGDNLADDGTTNLMRWLAAKLRRAGITGTGGLALAVTFIKASIKTRQWKPNTKSFLEGVTEGLEDGLRYHMRRFREIEQKQGKDALRKELDEILAPKTHAHDAHAGHGADPHHGGHGTDHGAHGAGAHGHTAPAAVVVHPYNDVDELMARHPQRAVITARLRAIRDRKPAIWQTIVSLDGRGAFFTLLADIMINNPDPSMAIDSIERSIVKHGKAADDERTAKARHPEDAWLDAVDNGFSRLGHALTRGAKAIGLDPPGHNANTHANNSSRAPGSLADAWDSLGDEE